MKNTIAVAVCTVLTACATAGPAGKPSQQPVPPELIPAGFTAAECHITDPGGPITEPGPDGRPVTKGTRSPKVECQHHEQGPVTTTTTPTCHTQGGKELPLSACCTKPDGSKIEGCTPQIQEPGT